MTSLVSKKNERTKEQGARTLLLLLVVLFVCGTLPFIITAGVRGVEEMMLETEGINATAINLRGVCLSMRTIGSIADGAGF